MADPDWGPVLDDLDARVAAAEQGDLVALEGWRPPAEQPVPMTADAQHRASGILGRQRALLARLRDEKAEVAAAMSAMRRPAYRVVPTPAPIYLDRLG